MANYGQPIPTEIPHDGDGTITSRKKWTSQEINAMSSAEYAKNLMNPDFVAAIDSIPGKFTAKADAPTEK